ncbi:MAG: hypothetical protein ACRCZS_20615 [Chroococcidiopsis sp.]
MKDISPQNLPAQNSQPPVTRWELIDAIAKLYVIKDPCNRSPKILNKPSRSQRQRPDRKS